MKVIHVLGASGFVGSNLTQRLAAERLTYKVGVRTVNDAAGYRFDLDNHFVISDQLKPGDTVILLSAVSSPDICVQRHDYAYRLNVTNTIAAIKSAIEVGASVIFASSDVVYGESPAEVDESSMLSPLGVYAEMKVEVEKHFLSEPYFMSVRFSYLWSSQDKFSLMVSDYILNNETLDIFDGLSRSVISVDDVCSALINLCRIEWKKRVKAVNFAGPECISRVEMAERIRGKYPQFNFTVSVPKDSFWAARPKVINMKSSFLESILGCSPISYNPTLEI